MFAGAGAGGFKAYGEVIDENMKDRRERGLLAEKESASLRLMGKTQELSDASEIAKEGRAPTYISTDRKRVLSKEEYAALPPEEQSQFENIGAVDVRLKEQVADKPLVYTEDGMPVTADALSKMTPDDLKGVKLYAAANSREKPLNALDLARMGLINSRMNGGGMTAYQTEEVDRKRAAVEDKVSEKILKFTGEDSDLAGFASDVAATKVDPSLPPTARAMKAVAMAREIQNKAVTEATAEAEGKTSWRKSRSSEFPEDSGAKDPKDAFIKRRTQEKMMEALAPKEAPAKGTPASSGKSASDLLIDSLKPKEPAKEGLLAPSNGTPGLLDENRPPARLNIPKAPPRPLGGAIIPKNSDTTDSRFSNPTQMPGANVVQQGVNFVSGQQKTSLVQRLMAGAQPKTLEEQRIAGIIAANKGRSVAEIIKLF